MIHTDSPVAILFVGALLIYGVVVAPLRHSTGLQPRPSKVFALAIVLAYIAYFRSALPLLICLWPVSLIWFPEYWGQYTGYLRGTYIDERSPPILISLLGWAFLVPLPLLVAWVSDVGL
ncbi:hypothetical protein Pla22_42390 [Rubripirellula amarantea]|uniref:Uncharacterized protein n=1 Tax=Rubripirellula amarantea TaxID=2527999 RepID=A0A5C5WMY6_9BACT|nr:hypothetical protein [Rubripirellula amarantea]TWT51461.1 hypothetical protein Pla22_42390 [Rubripirellula amarantea]